MSHVIIIFEDIIDYKYNFSTTDITITKHTKNDKYEKEKSYYFILDSNASRDFGYWIFENFIFIDLLIRLNKTIPNIKILSKISNYNIKNILEYFNINNEIVNKIDNYNNICYSPKIYSIYYIHRLNNDDYFNYFLINYINRIVLNLDININKYNNVFINFNPENPNYNEDIIKTLKMNNKNNNSIFIDNIHENIKYNLSVINNANTIILLFDPSLYYNCIFLEKKTIIIIEDNPFRPNGLGTQINANPFLDYLFNIIASKNNIYILKLENLLNK
jgi:hypothetical protein